MRCQRCHKDLKKAEPVYRVSTGYYSPWYEKFGGSVGYICATCAPLSGNRDWMLPRPCECCNRPVIHDIRRRVPLYVVCGKDCRSELSRSRSRSKHSLIERVCLTCNKQFIPTRSNARFCSNACRQRSYRSRLRARSRAQGLARGGPL